MCTQVQPKIRVLALMRPIERHVGHWACSSASLELRRVIAEGDGEGAFADVETMVLQEVAAFEPEAIAVVGKEVAAFHDVLDGLADRVPLLRQTPRVYRCQNTALSARIGAARPTRMSTSRMSTSGGWSGRRITTHVGC